MPRPTWLLALLAFTACDLARGDVVVVNDGDEPRLYAVAYGDEAWSRLLGPDDADGRMPLAPGSEVRIGRALAIADSGGITVAFYSVPNAPGAQPILILTEGAGAQYLREALGDTVFRID